jgi:hypothetical protein
MSLALWLIDLYVMSNLSTMYVLLSLREFILLLHLLPLEVVMEVGQVEEGLLFVLTGHLLLRLQSLHLFIEDSYLLIEVKPYTLDVLLLLLLLHSVEVHQLFILFNLVVQILIVVVVIGFTRIWEGLFSFLHQERWDYLIRYILMGNIIKWNGLVIGLELEGN